MPTADQVTIMVVDDDHGHVELVRRNLRRAGVNNPILPFYSGTEALDHVFHRKSSDQLLVLLDINMPGIDGVEVLRQIKANPTTRTIPVIMLTTTDDPREIHRCYELGCNVYVTKPVDPGSFIDAVNRLGLFIPVVSVP